MESIENINQDNETEETFSHFKLPPKAGYIERDGEYYPTPETQSRLDFNGLLVDILEEIAEHLMGGNDSADMGIQPMSMSLDSDADGVSEVSAKESLIEKIRELREKSGVN